MPFCAICEVATLEPGITTWTDKAVDTGVTATYQVAARTGRWARSAWCRVASGTAV